MWEYTDKVKDHFLNPRNVGVIEDADGIGEVGSLSCGDALKLTFKVGENEKIIDAKFQTFGCASAIASSSALTEIIRGLTVDDAAKVTNDYIAKYLGDLPKEKMHCSVMGRDALEKAIAHYRGIPYQKPEGEIVCECFGVTDLEINRAITENSLTSVEDVTDFVKAGGGCGNCVEKIQEIIDTMQGKERSEKKKPQKMTNIQKIKLIEEILEQEIKPVLKKDGGNIELIDLDENTIYVKLRGACANCMTSQVTIKNFIENKIKELVSPELNVKEVKRETTHIC
ncbi:NifU-like protein [Desulfosarcina sp. BuS5]|uniref:Fe-S cluster assembly protein NifU n=1 Tax=Desulfosarcina sp. BuS5 TaxID=933262 RepID=UPI000485ED1D|nr:Fe-S cluster assembly protein NifU [Desulfosarcina sp. BuS5]WDN87450.1 NifU-like protein [Desulfosarcina sp. BuS5]